MIVVKDTEELINELKSLDLTVVYWDAEFWERVYAYKNTDDSFLGKRSTEFELRDHINVPALEQAGIKVEIG